MFGSFKKHKSTIFEVTPEKDALTQASKSEPIVDSVSGVTVDASCNKIITITCLQQLYNAVGFVPSANVGNSIGITGYLVNKISLDSRTKTLLTFDTGTIREQARSPIILCRPGAGRLEFQLQIYIR
jgi:hypothetical protein